MLPPRGVMGSSSSSLCSAESIAMPVPLVELRVRPKIGGVSLWLDVKDAMLPKLGSLESEEWPLVDIFAGSGTPDCKAKSAPSVISVPPETSERAAIDDIEDL